MSKPKQSTRRSGHGTTKKSSSKSKSSTIKKNQQHGRAAEKAFERESKSKGQNITRSGKGHDYVQTKKDPRTGKIIRKRIEIKSGNSTLSKTQKRSRAQNSKNYEVHRYKHSTSGTKKTSVARGIRKKTKSKKH